MNKCFYLPSKNGSLFVSLYKPDNLIARKALIYVHPFGEEMNKSRRMVYLQAEKFIELGVAVFIVDLFGCGDSDGELKDAGWELWIDDLSVCYNWVKNNLCEDIGLWGLRLGALLSLDFAQQTLNPLSQLLFWKPVLKGKLYLNEFLRASLASEVMGNSLKKTSKKDIIDTVNNGSMVELSGYEINSSLFQSMMEKEYSLYTRKDVPIIWIDIVRNIDIENVAATNTCKYLAELGATCNYQKEKCTPFWSAVEITECPTLLNITTTLFKQSFNEGV